MPAGINTEKLVMPVNFRQEDLPFYEPHFHFRLLDPALRSLRNIFYFRNGVAVKADLSVDKEFLPWTNWADSYTKRFWSGNLLKALLRGRLNLQLKQQAIIVANPFSANYFHWMTEVLPKLIFLQQQQVKGLVFFHDRYLQDFQKATLDILQVSYNETTADVFFFRRCLTVSNFSEYPGYYYPEWINLVRNLLLGGLKVTPQGPPEKIYISRQKAGRRKIGNEKEIEAVLLSNGFRIVYPEDHSFAESLAIYANAVALVSCHGAALTNMIFLRPGAKVLELHLEAVVTDKCYFMLANACQLAYYYQPCKGMVTGDDHINADLLVDAATLEQNLQHMLLN
ncbi:MAG: glycosyltransferase family 61 protein [Ferruginibacter sp.]